MRFVSAGDSGVAAISDFKVYLLRTSTLAAAGRQLRARLEAEPARRGGRQPSRGEHTGLRGNGRRRERSSPAIGTKSSSSCSPRCGAACAGRTGSAARKIFEAANIYAGGLIQLQRQYASMAGLGLLDQSLEQLEQRLAQAREQGTCLLSLGWGGGLPAKSAWLDTTNPDYRQILQAFQIYNRALATNLPFPKTRRIVFLNNKPATLPGWAELSIEE